jgi:hypothetical protein
MGGEANMEGINKGTSYHHANNRNQKKNLHHPPKDEKDTFNHFDGSQFHSLNSFKQRTF